LASRPDDLLKNDKNTRTTGRPTLNEVARLAGVSPITASRALRGISSVATELAEKVRQAAAELNYVVNPAARALASAQSHSVVVLVPVVVQPAVYRHPRSHPFGITTQGL
jgi:LacI family transcriptional regulator, gluconate utilization system Gnt-I transcriptional repressor